MLDFIVYLFIGCVVSSVILMIAIFGLSGLFAWISKKMEEEENARLL